MVEIHSRKFVFRSFFMAVVFGMAVFQPQQLESLYFYQIGFFRLYHGLWLVMMLGMVQVFVPKLNRHVSCGRHLAKHYQPTRLDYTKEQLQASVESNNRGAIHSALFWSLLLSVIGLLLRHGIIGVRGIHLIVVFFYFADEFCINVWCPFRAWIIGNLCCNNCRIFNWGHLMIFSPFIFIPSFWTWSLVLVSFAILIQWEVMHARYSHRFSPITNANLQCINCLKAQCHYVKNRPLQL